MTPVNHSQNRLSKVFSYEHSRPRLQRLKTSRLSLLLTFSPRTSSSGLFLSEASVLPVTLEYMTHSRDFSCVAHWPTPSASMWQRTFKAATCTAFDSAKRFSRDAASPISGFQDHQWTACRLDWCHHLKIQPNPAPRWRAVTQLQRQVAERYRWMWIQPCCCCFCCYDGGGTPECDWSCLTGTSRSIQ